MYLTWLLPHGLYFFSTVYQVVCMNKPVIDIMQRNEQWSN